MSVYFLKLKTEIGMILFAFLSFITPIIGMVILVSVAVGIDTGIGIYIARKRNEYESHKLFNVVIKSFFYMSTILLSFLIDTYIFEKKIVGIDYLSSKIVSMFWIYIEGKSIDENSQKLGNRAFHIVLSELIKKIKTLKKDFNEIKE